MDPIQELKTEHRAVETALNILLAIADEITNDPNASRAREDAARMLEFLQTFVDVCHHGKEEDFLFPALEKIGVSRDGGPIGALSAEHVHGRENIRKMQSALDSLEKDNKPESAAAFRAHAAGYADLLRLHIDKEDNVLFELASQRLSSMNREALTRDFEKLEAERIGPGRHEQYHAMLEELERRYLRH